MVLFSAGAQFVKSGFRVSEVSRFRTLIDVDTFETLKLAPKTQNPPASSSGGGCELKNISAA